MIFVLGLNCSK